MKFKTIKSIVLLFLLAISFYNCQNQTEILRQTIDLSGQWQFDLDTANVGIKEQWFAKDLNDNIKLPGTTDSNQKGFLVTKKNPKHLNRIYRYAGSAWYRKKIIIPDEFANQHISFSMERTKPAMVWIDEKYVGESKLMQSPQSYDLSEYLTPGEHTITVLVNNDRKITPFGEVHIYTDETQTNWNGIIGEIVVEASPKTYINDLKVYPDIENSKAEVKLEVNNGLSLDKVSVELKVTCMFNGSEKSLESIKVETACDSIISVEYPFADDMELWDDYNQPIYKLTAVISNENFTDGKSTTFGMRDFAVNGKQFTINGRPTFLRGKHEAAVFPITAYPPMDVESWKRVYKISKEYGINHYRFHSYCPPEAAFTAADEEGIFLEAELPFWGGVDEDSVAAMLKAEGYGMLKSYGNHPSFVMFGPGNEIWGGHERVEKFMVELKEYDNRPLYTMGANNGIGFVPPRDYCDFFIGARTPSDGDTTLTHVRLTHGFCDSRDGGILNTTVPSTMVKFDYAVDQLNIPIISHEIGQYQIYPDYNEIKKYTGVLRAGNLEIFKKSLIEAGMYSQNMDFHNASGAWSAICYKAEMESAFRTKNFGGFQLLDLQDYPGQGTALVGILDAFMDSKNVVSPKVWKESCNDVVLLLEYPKYCWQNNEEFSAELVIANYSNKVVNSDVEWIVSDQKGNHLFAGSFEAKDYTIGNLTSAGNITLDLSTISEAERINIDIKIKGSDYTNSYPIWIYPAAAEIEKDEAITVVNELTDKLISEIENGASVLLLPDAESVKDKSVGGLFNPDFWNWGMFKSISAWKGSNVSPGTLGILTNPEHPLFNSFPTDSHTNWQWFSIVKASNPLILNAVDTTYRPIVQVIDNLERNNKLGMVFEFKVGEGKLLVCMSKLDDILDKPEAKQLYNSILTYMKSEKFAPTYTIDKAKLLELL